MYWIYVLQNSEDQSLYYGKTKDLKKRIRQHNSNKNSQKYTSIKTGYWRLIYAELYRSKKDADNRELKLKQHGSAKRFLVERINHSLKFESTAGRSERFLATVYQKHSSLLTRKRMYRG